MGATQYLLLVAIMAGFAGLEFFMGRAERFHATLADNLLGLVGFALLAAVTRERDPTRP